jgi:outer membrane immunogenic protein
MRTVVVGLALLGLAQSAFAADLPYLRGAQYEEPIPPYRWSGVYGGGQVGYSSGGVDFSGSSGITESLITNMLNDTTIQQDQTTLAQHIQISQPPLLKANLAGTSFGGFVGYNWQWEDAVAGIEVNYNRSSVSGSTSALITRSFVDSANLSASHHYDYTVLVDAAASAHVRDWGTFRVRGGWAAGRFLPYGFVALAVARVDISHSVTGTYSAVDAPDSGTAATVDVNCPPDAVCPTAVAAQTYTRNGAFAYGAAAGLGVDVALLPNVFLRGEWEYVQFAPLRGDHIHISTIRTALGLKF